MFLPPGELD